MSEYNKLPAREQERIEQAYRSAQHVYFVRAKKLRMIKIGIAREPHNRMRTMQVGSPVELDLVHVIPYGGRLIESMLFDYFKALHKQGEWYSYDKSIREFIKYAKTVSRKQGLKWNLKKNAIQVRG